VFQRDRREKQVRLTLFDNEPMARLAEQRLQQAGIRCVIRSLRGGPGLWGSAYNLPHDLCVFESDQMQAREILDLEPQELQERQQPGGTPRPRSTLWLVVAGIIIAALVLGIVVPAIGGSGG
jgi:hypothetical protein